MSRYSFEVRCMCGGELEHVTSGRPTSTESSAIVRCPRCWEEWHVLVRLLHSRDRVGPQTNRRRPADVDARRCAVVAEVAAEHGISEAARRFDIDRSTVRRMQERAGADRQKRKEGVAMAEGGVR